MIVLTGQKFGRLTVVEYAGINKWRNYKWLCLCECGKKKVIRSGSLRNGDTQSCGCLQKEITSIIKTKHGHKKKGKTSKIYVVWEAMIRRCTNPNYHEYHYHGGRGISVCERWRKFENFLEDMGKVPKGLQIDRIDNNGNYCKSNCRWVTPKEQQRNKRNNHLITYDGKTQCLAAWAEEFNICQVLLCGRIRLGWSTEKALTAPIGR